MQMHAYRCLKSVVAVATAPDIPQVVQPAPVAREKSRPTRFTAGRSVLHETVRSPQESTVETEFQKYASDDVSSQETDTLWFWVVRSF